MLVHGHARDARDRLSQPHDVGWIGCGVRDQVQRPTLWVERSQLDGRTDPRRDPEKPLGIDPVLRPFQLKTGPARGCEYVATADESCHAIPDKAAQRLT
ncbi:MAG: hypothetical protein ACRDM0_14575 [Thermoleophilaceae bacterium]